MTKTVIFSNDTDFDIRSLTVMGLHAKPESQSPIGHFGTGLKLSIGALIRLGQEVWFQINGDEYYIQKKIDSFRGTQYAQLQLVKNAGETIIDLPFTDDLGKHWKIWQAYRELHANCLDENGTIGTDFNVQAKTKIFVKGEEFYKAYLNRNEIFLPNERLFKHDTVEIYSKIPSQHMYYRGVRVFTSEDKPFRYTYNILGHCSLTEDRTVAIWEIEYWLKRGILQYFEKSHLLELLKDNKFYIESRLDFSDTKPSEAFIEACREIMDLGYGDVLPSARAAFNATQKEVIEPKDYKLLPHEQELFMKALDILAPLNLTNFGNYKIKFSDNLGQKIIGYAKNNTMYLDRKAFESGPYFLAETIYEEFIHLERGYPDCSRSMQNFLFGQVIALSARLANQ